MQKIYTEKLNKSDEKPLREALAKAERNLSGLRLEVGGDEAARLRKIINQATVIRAYRRMLRHYQTV